MLSENSTNIYKRLYSEANIDKILSDASFVKKILLFETMLAKANYEAKVIPYNAYCNIKKVISSSKFNTNILQDNIEFSGIITLNILNEIKKKLNKNYIPYLHYGVSSQDAIDTAIILQIKETRKLFTHNLRKASYNLFNLAMKHKHTYTLGRTRNKIATLTTFGFKAYSWLLPMLRHVDRLNKVYENDLLIIQLGGTVGNLALLNSKGNFVKKRVSKLLGLGFDDGNWQNQRDRIVEFCNTLSMITGSIGKIAKDILVLSQDEISEISFKTLGASSSMPHKRNPIIAELLISLAKLNSSHLLAMHDSLMHKNERDGISWMVEWKALNSMLRLTSASLNHFNKCLSSLIVNKDTMKKNIDNTYGVIFSDYFFQKLLQSYSYNKLKKIFPNLINKALKEKKYLLDIINIHLGENLNINKNKMLSNCIGLNNNLIKKIERKLKNSF